MNYFFIFKKVNHGIGYILYENRKNSDANKNQLIKLVYAAPTKPNFGIRKTLSETLVAATIKPISALNFVFST